MRYNNFISNNINKQYDKWVNVIESQELASIVHFPCLGVLDWRIPRFRDYIIRFQMKSNIIDLDPLEPMSIKEGLAKLGDSQVALIKIHQFHFDEFTDFFLKELLNAKIHTNVAFLIFLEIDPLEFHKKIFSGKLQYHLLQNVFYYESHKYQGVKKFIDYLGDKFELKIKDDWYEKIFEYCGCWFWVIKDILRRIKFKKNDDIDAIIKSESVRWRCDHICNNFSEESCKVMEAVSEIKKINEINPVSIQILKNINLINPELKHNIPGFIYEYLSRAEELTIKENEIKQNGVSYDDKFSKIEKKVIFKLLKAKEEVVSRSSIAEIIWPNGDYFDYNLDKFISRLRKKIKELGLNLKIKTKRGAGYYV